MSIEKFKEQLAALTSEESGVNVAEELQRVLSIPYNFAASNSAKTMVLGQGRVKAVQQDAPAPTPPPIELGGADTYTRPNGSKYFARKWGIHSDVAVLQRARSATADSVCNSVGSPMFALFYGNPGTGKTALVEAAFGADLYTIMGTGDTEVSDFIGGYVQTASGGFEWVDGPLLRAAEEGKPLFIDEIGLIDPKVLSLVYGVMDGRREIVVTANPERGVVKAHEDFYVVAATNPNAPGVRLSEALLSRFTLQVELLTDWGLAVRLGVNSMLVAAAQKLSSRMDTGEISWAPQMRELLAFRDIESVFGREFALQNLLASAPEMDRPVVSDTVSRAMGIACKPARI